MSNPTKAPTEAISSESPYYSLPLAYISKAELDVANIAAKITKIEAIYEAVVRPCGMRVGKIVKIPRELTASRDFLKQHADLKPGKSVCAIAPLGPAKFSIYSRTRARALKAMLTQLPSERLEEHSSVMRKTFFVGGGVQLGYGRLRDAAAWNKSVKSCLVPPTQQEADAVVIQCGLAVAKYGPTMLPLQAPPGAEGVKFRVNMKATIGLPVWATPAKNDEALPLALRLTYGFIEAVEQAYAADERRGVGRFMRDCLESSPHYVTHVMRVKHDYASLEKLLSNSLRTYQVPACVLKFSLGQLVQSAEMHARNILVSKEYTSSQRMGFAHLNAHTLINRLNAQLQASKGTYIRVAFSTGGDDSVIVLEFETLGVKYHVTISLDYSTFDHTQTKVVRKPVLKAWANELAAISPSRAQLFYEVHTSRPTVVGGKGVAQIEDGGISGLPGQSEVNDMLNTVVLNRIKALVEKLPEYSEERIRGIITSECRKMGFKVKIDAFDLSKTTNLLAHVALCPMLFLGFYITRSTPETTGDPQPFAVPILDPHRLISRLAMRKTFDPPTDAEEVLSLAGVVMSMGHMQLEMDNFLAEYYSSYRALARHVMGLLKDLISKNAPFPSDKARTAIGGLVYVNVGEATWHSWSGILEAVRHPERIFSVKAASKPFRLAFSDDEEPDDYVDLPYYQMEGAPPQDSKSWADDDYDAIDPDPQLGEIQKARGVKKPNLPPLKISIVPLTLDELNERHFGRAAPTQTLAFREEKAKKKVAKASVTGIKSKKAALTFYDDDAADYDENEDEEKASDEKLTPDEETFAGLDEESRARVSEYINPFDEPYEDTEGDDYYDAERADEEDQTFNELYANAELAGDGRTGFYMRNPSAAGPSTSNPFAGRG